MSNLRDALAALQGLKAITDEMDVLFQNSAERESVSLQGFGWSGPHHSRSTWHVLDPVLFRNPALRRSAHGGGRS